MHIGVVSNGKKRFLSQKLNSFNVTRPLSLVIYTAFLDVAVEENQIKFFENSLSRVSSLVLDLNKVSAVLLLFYCLFVILLQGSFNVVVTSPWR